MDLIDLIPHIVWTSDGDGAMDYANRRWVEYTGIGLDDAKGMGWLAALHLDDAASVASTWRQAVLARADYEAECRLRRASDGTYRWHLCRAVPKLDADRQIVAWLGTYTDYDDQRRTLHTGDELIALATHELRTPLTALKLRLEALTRGNSLKGKLQERIENALAQAFRLEGLIDEVVDASRLAAGRLQICTEGMDLAQLTAEILTRRRAEAEHLGIRLESSCATPVFGNWDRARVEQLISNLVSEVFRYSRGGSVNVQVGASGRSARLSIIQRGGAFGPSALSAKLERAATAGNGRDGLSLGFYVARQIVRLLGGSIELRSLPEHSAAFTVQLPLCGELAHPAT